MSDKTLTGVPYSAPAKNAGGMVSLFPFRPQFNAINRPLIAILCNGILAFPGDAKNWNKRGVGWFNSHFDEFRIHADLCEYFCTALGRAIWQRQREIKLANLIRFYLDADFEIILVGHSNGCDVCLGALQRLHWPRIKALHLFSAATEADCRHNGLNWSVERLRIGRVICYVAGQDRWLRLARWPVGEILGYDGAWHWDNLFTLHGALGYDGPIHVAPVNRARILTIREPEYDHSTWWSPEHFDDSMQEVV